MVSLASLVFQLKTMNNSNIIRKIVVGADPKNGLAYKIGNTVGENEIVDIQLDERALSLYGLERYLVYVQAPDGGIVLWKQVSGCPTMIEFDINF
jgi:hypothetical protein